MVISTDAESEHDKIKSILVLNSQEIRNGEGRLNKNHGVRYETIISGQETTLSSTLPAGSVLCSAGMGGGVGNIRILENSFCP